MMRPPQDNLFRRALNGLALLAFCLCAARSARAHEGWGIVVDGRGHIYFSDIPTNTVWRFTREGGLEPLLPNKHSHALVLGEDGSVYGTDEHRLAEGRPGHVWRLAPGGQLSNVFSATLDFPGNLHPFIIDREGHVYTTNLISFPGEADKATLLKVAPDGGVTVVAGGLRGHRDGRGAEAQFSGIDGMAWAGDGSLYVTDGARVRRVGADGTVTTLGGALTGESFGEDLMGLAVAPGGGLYVADYSGGRLLEMKPGGGLRTVLETGWVWSPTGVTLAGGDLYLLEHLRMPLVILGDLGVGPYARVRKVSPGGAASHVVTVWGRNTAVFAAALFAVTFLVLFWLLRRRGRGVPSKV